MINLLASLEMAFYIIRNRTEGNYLSLRLGGWVADLREAAVFSARSTAVKAIPHAWRDICVVERIERLPDGLSSSRALKQEPIPGLATSLETVHRRAQRRRERQ